MMGKPFWLWLVAWGFGLGFIPLISAGAVIEVGPGKKHSKPSEAARVAEDGDVIEITGGTYMHDVAIWEQDGLTIRGVGGRAHLKADGAAAEEKAIWVIKGNHTTVENLEFSGSRVRDKNGAGIRQEGTDLTVRNCYFHRNEMGILTGQDEQSSILIEYSEFADNTVEGDSDEYGHNIYIGRVGKFELKFSYVHDGHIGNNVKSRALESHILYNRIMDERNHRVISSIYRMPVLFISSVIFCSKGSTQTTQPLWLLAPSLGTIPLAGQRSVRHSMPGLRYLTAR